MRKRCLFQIGLICAVFCLFCVYHDNQQKKEVYQIYQKQYSNAILQTADSYKAYREDMSEINYRNVLMEFGAAREMVAYFSEQEKKLNDNYYDSLYMVLVYADFNEKDLEMLDEIFEMMHHNPFDYDNIGIRIEELYHFYMKTHNMYESKEIS